MAEIDKGIIERIRKLLAMAGDTGSPHEAAIAARRAEALMRRHNIESSAAILGELKNKDNMTKQAAHGNIWRKKARSIPAWSQHIAYRCAELFDAHVVLSRSPSQGYFVMFLGYHTDVEVCIWTYTYLLTQCKRFSERYSDRFPLATRAEKSAYHSGVSRGIMQGLMEAKHQKDLADRENSTCTALVVAKRSAIEDAFGTVTYKDSKKKVIAGEVAHAFMVGLEDGKSVKVNPRVLTGGEDEKAMLP